MGKINFGDGPDCCKYSGPANYRIVVCGNLGIEWRDRLAGMQISDSTEKGGSPTSTLSGPIRDQSELCGVIDTLHDLHLTILKLERIGDKNTINMDESDET